MMNKTMMYVIETVSEVYNIEMEKAKEIVTNSFFPEILKEMPDYVQHYDAEYWASEIMSDIMAR